MTIREKDANGPILAQFTLNKAKKNTTSQFKLKNFDRKTDIYIETQNDAIAPEVNILNVYWVGFIPDMPGQDKNGMV